LRILFSFALTLLLSLPGAHLPAHGQKTAPVSLLEDQQFFHVLSEHIAGADREIVVSMFLFRTRPYPSNRAHMILKDLVAAHKRGVRVQVLLERTARDNDFLNQENVATSDQLRQGGVLVSFDSLDTTTHTKAIVIDRRFVFIGSHNLTHSALFHNHELSVLIDNPDLAKDVLRYLRTLED
jgi:phosphatidylserine/phosphatidylglycerophosphate/cardiolipin synthase-like enzyme